MTTTEDAAVAAAYAWLIAAVFYRSITLAQTWAAVRESARSTAAIGMLIAGALALNYVITSENAPNTVRCILAGWEMSPWQFLLVVNLTLNVLSAAGGGGAASGLGCSVVLAGSVEREHPARASAAATRIEVNARFM